MGESREELTKRQAGEIGAMLGYPSGINGMAILADLVERHQDEAIAWAQRHTGAAGGQARTDAKAKAARANGARGGRPRKEIKDEPRN